MLRVVTLKDVHVLSSDLRELGNESDFDMTVEPPSGDDGDNNPSGDDNNPSGDDNNPSGDDNNPPGDDNNPPVDDNNPPGDDNNPSGDADNNPSGDADGNNPSGNDDAGDNNPPGNEGEKKAVISDPYECDFNDLTSEEEDDFRQRVHVVQQDSKPWLNSQEGQQYYGQVNLLLSDPPWGVLNTEDGLRADDKLYHSDIPGFCDHTAKLLTANGTALIRTSIQEWMLWAKALEAAHLHVEKVPIIMVKHPTSCAYVQTRWRGRTSSAFFYVVAHKSARDFIWTRPKSGFIPANIYPPSSNVIIGIVPPRKRDRLLDHNGNVIRPQVCECVYSMTL